MRTKVILDTYSDILDFVAIAGTVEPRVKLSNFDRSFIVNAKSLLGVLSSIEWNEDLFCECDEDIYSLIERFTAD